MWIFFEKSDWAGFIKYGFPKKFAPIWPHSARARGCDLIPVLSAPPPPPSLQSRLNPKKSGENVFWGVQRSCLGKSVLALDDWEWRAAAAGLKLLRLSHARSFGTGEGGDWWSWPMGVKAEGIPRGFRHGWKNAHIPGIPTISFLTKTVTLLSKGPHRLVIELGIRHDRK